QSTPIELIYDGDTVYSNANAMAALANPDVRPWIRQRRNATHVDDVDHVRALALLATAVTDQKRLGEDHYRARVEPGRLDPQLRSLVRGGDQATPFPAEVWLGGNGLLARGPVPYGTPAAGETAAGRASAAAGAKGTAPPRRVAA